MAPWLKMLFSLFSGKLLNEKLVKVFQRFKKEEVIGIIIPLIPNVPLNDIKAGLKHYKLQPSPKNIGKLVVHLLRVSTILLYRINIMVTISV